MSRKWHTGQCEAPQIFVFGSNRQGVHGAGGALHAHDYRGAKHGVGEGPTGQAYALPTKWSPHTVMDLEEIARAVGRFKDYAARNTDQEFFVTRVGCGLAGYTDEEIAPLFVGAPENCVLSMSWRKYFQ